MFLRVLNTARACRKAVGNAVSMLSGSVGVGVARGLCVDSSITLEGRRVSVRLSN